MKRAVFLLIYLIFSTQLWGAESKEKAESKENYIKKKLMTGLHVSQVSYRNWSAGGEDALSWTARVDGKYEKSRKKFYYRWRMELEFGQVRQAREAPRISANKIHLDGMISWKVGLLVNPFLSLRMDTQMTRAYDYDKSPRLPKADFLDPVILQQSAGIGFNPLKSTKTRFGIALKETRSDEFWVYSDDPKTAAIEKVKVETGIDQTTEINKKFNDNLILKSRIELFTSFENFSTVDVRWQNDLQAKLARYVAVNIRANYLYDKDVTTKSQFMNSITVGLTYNFFE